jgi:hypothetical protein
MAEPNDMPVPTVERLVSFLALASMEARRLYAGIPEGGLRLVVGSIQNDTTSMMTRLDSLMKLHQGDTEEEEPPALAEGTAHEKGVIPIGSRAPVAETPKQGKKRVVEVFDISIRNPGHAKPTRYDISNIDMTAPLAPIITSRDGKRFQLYKDAVALGGDGRTVTRCCSILKEGIGFEPKVAVALPSVVAPAADDEEFG